MRNNWEKLLRPSQSGKAPGGALDFVQQSMDDETHDRLPSLTLARYVDFTAEVPPPTAQQRENFVEHVAHAHSWYKHLPLALPGNPFYFFVDKYAACARVIMEDGTQAFTERTEKGFHYSDIPTEQCRARFGHLAYSCDAGTTVFRAVRESLVLPRDKVVAAPGPDTEMYGLPAEILEAGLAHLTAVIHTLGATRMAPWDHVREWPEGSGGQAVLEKIVARSRVMRESSFQREETDMEVDDGLQETNPDIWMHLPDADRVLYELLAPERRRQYGTMKKAMDRVC